MHDFKTIHTSQSLAEASLRVDWSVPSEFYLACTDVRNSTEAIENGRYRDVNVAGALGIMAIARIYNTLEIPFSFGGDGMFCLVEPDAAESVTRVLAKTVRDVKQILNLELRAALIPIGVLHDRGAQVGISKYQVAPTYRQAVFHGRGLLIADSLLKSNQVDEVKWHISAAEDQEPGDYEGFSCRWEDIPSTKSVTAALIVEPRGFYSISSFAAAIDSLLGGTENYHPIEPKVMHPGGPTSNWKLEALVSSGGKRSLKYVLRLIKIRLLIAAVNLARRLNLPLKSGVYQANIAAEQNKAASDYMKLDGSLKLIFSADKQQISDLEKFLSEETKQGHCYFGLHTTHSAHMTCLANNPTGEDLHFVDATEGGYAQAAKRLKAQRALASSNRLDQKGFFSELAPYYESVFTLGPETKSFIETLLLASPENEYFTSKGEAAEPSVESLYSGKVKRMLDIGCATGELLRKMTGSIMNFEGTGFDFDSAMIREAQKNINSAGLSISKMRVYQGSLTDPAAYSIARQRGPFDLVSCLGNTIIHSKDIDSLRTALVRWHELLLPNGWVVIQLLNYDYLTKYQIEDLPLIQSGLIGFERRYEYLANESVIFHSRLTRADGTKGLATEPIFDLRPFQLGELLNSVGFSKILWYSSFNLTPLESDDAVIVCLAQKK